MVLESQQSTLGEDSPGPWPQPGSACPLPQAWLTEIHEYAQRDVVIMLLGNKADVSSERVIRSEDGETLAREYGVPFMETSAKTGMNVELAFLAIAKELKYRAGRQPDEPSFQIRDYVESQKKRSSCCSFV